MPFLVVIDRDGKIRERIEGIIFADEFDEKIKPLLESGLESIVVQSQFAYLPAGIKQEASEVLCLHPGRCLFFPIFFVP